jgi:hypothetical protein
MELLAPSTGAGRLGDREVAVILMRWVHGAASGRAIRRRGGFTAQNSQTAEMLS